MKIPVDKHARLTLARRITSARQYAILAEAAQLAAYAKQIAEALEWRAAAPARAAAAKERKRLQAEAAAAAAEAAALAAAEREAERERQRLIAAQLEAERLAQWEADAPLRAADAARVAEAAADLAAQAKVLKLKEQADAKRLRLLAARLPYVPRSKSNGNAPRFQIFSIGTTMAEIMLGRDLGVRSWNVYGHQIEAGKRMSVNNHFLSRMLDDPRLMLVEQVQR